MERMVIIGVVFCLIGGQSWNANANPIDEQTGTTQQTDMNQQTEKNQPAETCQQTEKNQPTEKHGKFLSPLDKVSHKQRLPC